jgi:hypothetical protein
MTVKFRGKGAAEAAQGRAHRPTMEATQIRQQGWKAIDGSPYGLRWRQKGLAFSQRLTRCRSGSQTRRRLAIIQPQVRYRGEAEVGRQAKPAESVENDPKPTLDGGQSCSIADIRERT